MKIDVLMPFRNAAATLPAALASIAAQTFKDFRLIAVDDGSSDGSVEAFLSPSLASLTSLLVPSRNRGLVAALNAGLAAATAPLVARMDADDSMMPDRLAIQCAALEEHRDWGAVASRVAIAGAGPGFRHYVAWSNALLTPEDISLNRFVESPIVHPSISFRTELVRNEGPYRDGDFPEDYELWLRWLEAGVKIGKTPDTLLQWNDAGTRLSRTDPRYSVDAFYRLKSEYLARWLAVNNPHHPAVLVWGAGYRTRQRVKLLQAHGIRVEAWIDISPRRKSTSIEGVPVIMPDEVPAPGKAFVLPYVGTRGAREQIASRLEDRGFVAGRNFICAA